MRSLLLRMLLIFKVLAANSWNNFAFKTIAETEKAFNIIQVSTIPSMRLWPLLELQFSSAFSFFPSFSFASHASIFSWPLFRTPKMSTSFSYCRKLALMPEKDCILKTVFLFPQPLNENSKTKIFIAMHWKPFEMIDLQLDRFLFFHAAFNFTVKLNKWNTSKKLVTWHQKLNEQSENEKRMQLCVIKC